MPFLKFGLLDIFVKFGLLVEPEVLGRADVLDVGPTVYDNISGR
jgi:hypothetical protein